MITNQNFTMVAGDTQRLVVTVTQTTNTPVFVAVNLGEIQSASWSLARTFEGPILIAKTTGNGIAFTDPINGVLQILLEPVDTAHLESGRYYHELVMVDFTGAVSTVMSGYTIIMNHMIRP